MLLKSGQGLLTGGYDYTNPNLYDPMNGVYTKATEIYQPPVVPVLDKFIYLPETFKGK